MGLDLTPHQRTQPYFAGAEWAGHPGRRHSRYRGAAEIDALLTHLRVVGKVLASTRNQAKSALLFLYPAVLDVDLPWLTDVAWARQDKRLPVVLTVAEVQAVLARVIRTRGLMWRCGSPHRQAGDAPYAAYPRSGFGLTIGRCADFVTGPR